MEYVYTIGSDGELYHWGIKGMKWGVRRYQNADGSLTPAGKKRYGSGTNSSDATTTPKKKSVSEMSDDEIRSAIARKQLENQYGQLHPQAAKQESFIKKFVDQAVKPAAINAGKDFIEKSLKKVTGDILKDKVDPNSLEGLEAANKKLRAQIANEWLKKGIDTTANWEAANKQYGLQKDMKKDADAKKQAEADAKAAKDKAKADKKAAKAEAEAKASQEAAEKAKSEREQRKAQQRKEWETYVRSHDETMKQPVDYFVGTPAVTTGRTAVDRINLDEFLLDWDDD